MPRMSIWLPEDLHRAVKELGLPVSELAQDAVVAELERRRKVAALDAYLDELDGDLGAATDEERAQAAAWAERVRAAAHAAPRHRSA